ncbi:LTA synthase family protein [uncultured Endozoicomonas sp.]|uniref:LTA synthase family protein n=1 Tax=uncultured Endozoicomonas sp. TaxID=432652 RepID=UPI00260D4C92|nr:LTA synthase family protein [uncultured Endozoicomonas sp.]
MKRYSLKSDLCFTGSAFFTLMILSTLARLLLFFWNKDVAATSATVDLTMGFLVGMRFDLIISCAAIIPMALAIVMPSGLYHRKVWKAWLTLVSAMMLLTALVEPIFYDEFHNRLNSIAIQYLNEDPATVLSMLINGTPFFTLLFVWIACIAMVFGALQWFDRQFRTMDDSGFKAWLPRLPAFLALILLLGVGVRGGTLRSGAPLRWGDAVHSQDTFANQLALNGMYTFIKAVEGLGDKKGANLVWLEAMDNQNALNITRQMVLEPEDKLLDPTKLALYRETTPKQRTLPENVKNVVIILMESFSSRYTASEGSTLNITPYFDALTKEGVLFNRAFSNGTHTHQGMFATFSCFPNTPGNEYLMQSPEGDTHFSGYAPIFNDLDYKNNVYVYNGAFNWDNQQGFFGNQGINRFIGRDQMDEPHHVDPTWGVSDEDMFDKSLEELDRLASKDEPFFAMLQSLSNHMPYSLPEKLYIEPVTDQGSKNERLTVMRYSDWALGQFFESAKKTSWYNDTLFVLLGDHGFSVDDILTPIDMLRHQIPVLMIAPGLQEAVGETVSTVMSQVDVVPTAASLFGKPYAQHCWGRDILSVDKNDHGFAIFKPSGSSPVVAMVKGDKVLVKQPDIEPELFSYSLGKNPTATRIESSETEATLYEELSAYLQTALRSLNNRSVGEKPGLEKL